MDNCPALFSRSRLLPFLTAKLCAPTYKLQIMISAWALVAIIFTSELILISKAYIRIWGFLLNHSCLLVLFLNSCFRQEKNISALGDRVVSSSLLSLVRHRYQAREKQATSFNAHKKVGAQTECMGSQHHLGKSSWNWLSREESRQDLIPE